MSRQATQLAMGPWFIRDEQKPFMPGFNAEVLKHQAMSGRIKPGTLLRGPTTHQFWMPAAKVPGVSRLLGVCHACAAAVAPHAKRCPKCDADLALPEEIDRLGLSYVTEEERAAAQRELAEGRSRAAAKPAAAPTQRPKPSADAAASTAAASSVTPAKPTEAAGDDSPADVELSPIDDAPAADAVPDDTAGAGAGGGGGAAHAYFDAEGHDIEELWDAAPTSPRRRAKRTGPDPLVLGAGALLLLVIFVAGFFLMQAAADKNEENLADNSSSGNGSTDTNNGGADPAPVVPPPPPRPVPTDDQMEQVLDQLLPVMDRLRQSGVPATLLEEYDALVSRVDEARVAHEAGDLGLAYELYREADRDAGLLDVAVAEHEMDMNDLQEAEHARAQAYRAREQARADDAERWAPKDWALAEQGLAAGEAALTSDQEGALLDAYDAFRTAVSDYEFARSQASLGFLAVQADQALVQAIGKSFTAGELAEYGGEPYTEMRDLQARGRAYLEEGSYYDALDAFEIGLLRLEQAERGVKRAYGVKFYCFAAGYAATDALIAVAAGDGLSAAKRELLGEAFGELGLASRVMNALPEGESPEYAACAAVLVGQAREVITSELGLPAQLSYSIGFQFRIVQQTLENPRLSADHTSRIGRTLRLIQEQSGQAGYSRELVAMLDEFKATLRHADSPEGLERARTAWRDILITLRTYDRAMPIVNPAATDPQDPELFPDSGTNGN